MQGNGEINYALVEETRPQIYTAMKYWGKKPHNIWRKYIETYTPEGGLYLDPFAGSAVSAFEAVKAGKKAIAFDLNPLTAFIIEVFSTKFDKDNFTKKVKEIINTVEKDELYLKLFVMQCPNCKNKNATIQSAKWESKKIYEIGIICPDCKEKKTKKVSNKNKQGQRYICREVEEINKNLGMAATIKIPFWYPTKKFHKSESFTANFIEGIGGNDFSYLWTKRNLYVIAKMFDEILKVDDDDLKKQLLFGFIQTIHLCTKMSVPRRAAANRDFSTSWGRSAYICSNRKMEMNSLLVFQSSCFGKQSVECCLSSIESYIGKIPKIKEVNYSNRRDRSQNFDIKYGIIDINTITDYLDEQSVDFIMTDPPYGGLVQYLDLSSIWLVWLGKYNEKFYPNYEAEITVNRATQDLSTYKKKFGNGIKNLFKILKNNGKIVFTFHNKKIVIWNAFLNSIAMAGFKIEKVIHQQNRRTGESNVANPYGTSATDFYIRCVKSPVTNLKTNKEEFEEFVVKKAIQLIAQRNEPTPFQILFNGLLVEISWGGFDLQDFDENVESFLKKHTGKIFQLTTNDKNNAGNFWWFVTPEEYIKYPDRALQDRVEETIIALLRRKVSVSFDDVVGEIFVKYPNGLTPDIKSIDSILKKYAIQSNGRWVYKRGEVEEGFTKHTEILFNLSKIGGKAGYKVYIGKREQAENYRGKNLIEYSNITSLQSMKYDKERRKRIEMIDMLWIDDKNEVKLVFEVENSTNFTSGIQRGSNLGDNIPKLMIVPDSRQKEFMKLKDPLFLESFKKHNWQYMLYSDVFSLVSSRVVSIKSIFEKFSKGVA